VVCLQVAASATRLKLVQGNLTCCFCLIVCDFETSKWWGLGWIWIFTPHERRYYNDDANVRVPHALLLLQDSQHKPAIQEFRKPYRTLNGIFRFSSHSTKYSREGLYFMTFDAHRNMFVSTMNKLIPCLPYGRGVFLKFVAFIIKYYLTLRIIN
jgi:hypothetical protein